MLWILRRSREDSDGQSGGGPAEELLSRVPDTLRGCFGKHRKEKVKDSFRPLFFSPEQEAFANAL